jgi:hypothetical protein
VPIPTLGPKRAVAAGAREKRRAGKRSVSNEQTGGFAGGVWGIEQDRRRFNRRFSRVQAFSDDFSPFL